MSDKDEFARQLLEESKYLFELASSTSNPDHVTCFAHSSLFLAFASLEAHVNAIADDFSERPELSVFDRSVLFEKELELKSGAFELREKLKIYRLEDRVQYLYRLFTRKPLDKSKSFWTRFKQGTALRNDLTHPKDVPTISTADVARSIEAIVELIDHLYLAIYKKNYPSKQLGLHTTIG